MTPALLLAAALSWPVCDHGQPSAACVVDGDTIHWQGVKIRLAESDAPETAGAHCPAEYAAGIRARDRLAELLGKGAAIEPTGRLDRYGRTLATVRIAAGDVEMILIGEGVSLPYRGGKAAHAERVGHWCSQEKSK